MAFDTSNNEDIIGTSNNEDSYLKVRFNVTLLKTVEHFRYKKYFKFDSEVLLAQQNILKVVII